MAKRIISIAVVSAVLAVVSAQLPVITSSIRGYLQKDPITGMLNGSLPLQPYCYVSRQEPFVPFAVPEFCYAFAQSTCCLPYHDYDMQQNWVMYLGTGKQCAQTAQQPAGQYQALKEFWCVVCDPEQYLYTTVFPLVPDAPQNIGVQATISYAMCRSFVDRLWPVTDPATGNSNYYDSCAFSYPTMCANNKISLTGTAVDSETNATFTISLTSNQVTFQNGGYFMCGNDVIIPSADIWNAMNFMNGVTSRNDGGALAWLGLRSPEADPVNVMFTIAEDNLNCYNGFNDSSSSNNLSPSSFVILLSIVAAVISRWSLI